MPYVLGPFDYDYTYIYTYFNCIIHASWWSFLLKRERIIIIILYYQRFGKFIFLS